MSNLNSKKFASIVYVVFLGSGIVQFGGQVLLARVSTTQDFSQMTWVLNLFASYLLFVDQGLQGHLMMKLSEIEERPKVLSSIIRMRLFGACIGIVCSIIHGYFAKVSYETHLSLFFFSCSLIPSAFLFTYEALGYRERHVLASTIFRIARSIAIMAFVAILFFNHLSNYSQYMPLVFLTFFVVYSGAGAVVYRKWPVRLSLSDKSFIFIEMKTMWKVMLGCVIWFIFQFAFAAHAARLFGEENLAEFNAAQLLSIPFTLLNQVLSNTWLTRFNRSNAGKSLAIYRFKGQAVFVVSAICYFIAISGLHVSQVFFKNFDEVLLLKYCLAFCLGHAMIGIVSMQTIVAQSFKVWTPTIGVPIILLASFCVFAGLQNAQILPKDQLAHIWFYSLAVSWVFSFVYGKISLKEHLSVHSKVA